MRRLVLSSLVVSSVALAACGVLPGSKEPSSGSTTTTSSGADGNGGGTKPEAPAFADRDEGSAGPIQAHHEGQIVFANAPIGRTDDEAKLVTSTTLDKPLFLRAYYSQTAARVLHDNGQTYCKKGSDAEYKFSAVLEGADQSKMDSHGVMLRHKLNDDSFLAFRSLELGDASGQKSASIVPQELFELSTGFDHSDNPGAYRFITLASMMQPGKNVITVHLSVGCDGHSGKNGREFTDVATGQITIDVKAGDLQAFSKKIARFAPSADAGVEAKLKPGYAKSLADGTTVLKFAAEKPVVQSVMRRTTAYRAIVRHKSGKCGWIYGSYEDPNKSNLFNDGHFTPAGEYALPCPE